MPCPKALGEPQPGINVGGYVLVRELGRGSGGTVWLAEHEATGLKVAVKIAPSGSGTAAARRLAIEARSTNQVVHEAVVNVFDFNEDDPAGAWLVMEALDGAPLSDLAGRALPLDEGLGLLVEIGEALDAMHARGIVHGALRPSNVFLTVSGTQSHVKLLPFGVDASEPDPADVPYATLGDPLFRAPEQTGGGPAHARADIYALGGLAYLLATGRPPFVALTPGALTLAHAEVTPDAPHRVNTRVPRALSVAILRALEKDPAARFASASEAASAWRTALERAEPMASSPSPVPTAKPAPVTAGLSDDFVVTTPRSPHAVSSPSPVPTSAPVSAPPAVASRPSPAPTSAPASAPVAAGLAEGFVVSTTKAPTIVSSPSPAPTSAPASAPVAAGLAEGFVVSTTRAPTVVSSPSPAPASAPAPVTAGLADGFVVTETRAPAPAPLEVPEAGHTPAVRTTIIPSAGPSAPGAPNAPKAPAVGLVLRAVVTLPNGSVLGEFPCSNVSRSGLVVCTDQTPPPMLSQVKLTLLDVDGLICQGQVVQHISPQQAAEWKMTAGFGVAFSGLSPEQRSRLESAHRGLRPPETPSGVSQRPDDPAAAEVLRKFGPERAHDGYLLLGLSRAAPFDAIRDRVREGLRALEALKQHPLSVGQKKALEEAVVRLELIGSDLGDPAARLEYDARLGNFEGIARCINAGVPVAEIEAARSRYLEKRPEAAAQSAPSIEQAQKLEAAGQAARAMEVYASALKLDPLNLKAQQRYWSVRRRLAD